MKKQLILIILILLGVNCYSQNLFKEGYYINNSGEKVQCLIKDLDWMDNPTKFDCKQSDSSEVKTLNIESVKEFGITNDTKYIRYNVEIDKSTDFIADLNYDKNPSFKNETLFLKVLLEGKASLYFYRDNSISKFFFGKDSINIKQLVYKSYFSQDDKILQNNAFRYQLWDELKCENISITEVTKLNYKTNELIDFFAKYNSCKKIAFINYNELKRKQKRDLFHLTLRPGLKYSSLLYKNDSYNWKQIKFDSHFSFRIGLEAELLMPFNNQKWAIAIEPNYQYFQSEESIITSRTTGDKLIVNVKYSSVEIPISIRYYMYLNEQSKIFVNTSLIFDSIVNDEFKFTRPDGALYNKYDLLTTIDYAIGVGYKHNKRYSCEFRYQFGRDILGSYIGSLADFQSLSLVFGYTIF